MKCTAVSLVFVLMVSSAFAEPERVQLAAEDNWYPYSAKVNSGVEGRSVDIVKAAYEAVGVELKLEVVPFNRGMILTKAGAYAGVFNGGVTEDVKRDFQIPRNTIALSEQAVVARLGEPFQGPESFRGKRLTLTVGYTYPTDITSDPLNTIERTVADIGNLKKIAADRADFTIIDHLVFLSILTKEPELKQKLAIVGKLKPDKIYVLFARSDAGTRALELFDQGMDKISRNGDLKKIIHRWDIKLR